MSLVTRIMRHHRRMQSLLCAVQTNPGLRSTMMVELIDAVMLHASGMEAVGASLRDAPIRRELAAHRIHHDRARASLFRIATRGDAHFEQELAALRDVLRDHTQHEMGVIGVLRGATEEQLVMLGDDLARFERSVLAHAPDLFAVHGEEAAP